MHILYKAESSVSIDAKMCNYPFGYDRKLMTSAANTVVPLKRDTIYLNNRPSKTLQALISLIRGYTVCKYGQHFRKRAR